MSNSKFEIFSESDSEIGSTDLENKYRHFRVSVKWDNKYRRANKFNKKNSPRNEIWIFVMYLKLHTGKIPCTFSVL